MIVNVVMFVIERAAQIMEFVESVVNSIHAIATGAIGGAISKVEQALGNMVPILIGFLAALIGLGGIGAKIKGFIQKVQAKVDQAIDKVLKKAVAFVKKMFGKLGGSKEDKRTEQEKTRDKLAGIAEAERLLQEKGYKEQKVVKKLPGIKKKFKLLTLDLVVDAKDDKTNTVHFTASASKVEKGKPKKVKVAAEMQKVVLSNPFIAREKKATKKKLATTYVEFERQITLQQQSLCDLKVSVWKSNWKKFHGDGTVGGEGRTGESKASATREALIVAERVKVAVKLKKDHPTATDTAIEGFLDNKLFARNPGDKAYPFKNKSAVFEKVSYINPVYGKALLHGADQVVGGGEGTADLGGARENYSIGAQWDRGGRALSLKAGIDAELGKMASTSDVAAINDTKLVVELPVTRV